MGQQKTAERVLHAGEAQATRPKADPLRGLAAKLHHQIVRHHRRQQFLLHHLHACSTNVLRVQRGFYIPDVVFHIVATRIEFAGLIAGDSKRCDQLERVAF